MRGRSYILLLLASLLFAACDPAYDINMGIRNSSGHTVILMPPGDSSILNSGPWHYLNRAGLDMEIEADSCYEFNLSGGVGCASREEAEWWINNILVPDSAVFVFADGHRLVYYSDDTLTDGSPYNFNSTNYDWSEKYGYTLSGHRNTHPYYIHIAYTLTQEQYEQSN